MNHRSQSSQCPYHALTALGGREGLSGKAAAPETIEPAALDSEALNEPWIQLDDHTEVLAQMHMIGLTEEDLKLIASFGPVISSQIERVTASFYDSVGRVDSLEQIIIQHSTVERLRQTLSNHLIEMFNCRINPTFIEKRLRIAAAHQRIGLSPKWYMGAFQNLQNTLLDIIRELDERIDTINLGQAVTKLLSFEQQLVLEAYESKIQHQADHDELTGLPNRRMFNQVLSHLIEGNRDSQTEFAVMMLDIDRFKMINDSLGHTYGDIFLKEMSTRIRDSIDDDRVMLARMGGDEFTLICSGDFVEDKVSRLARSIISAIGQPYHLKDNDFYVTASIGIAIYPDHGLDAVQLLKNADTAMYEVKKGGKNGYQFYTNELDVQLMEKIELEGYLRKAIAKNELMLYYQPQIRTGDSRMVGVEALVRWNHPTKGVLSPGMFIPIAEETGMITEIGTWVLREACRQMREWHLQGGPLIPVSVNLSSHQFHQSNLVDYIKSILEETGLEPQYLELEITESMMMDASVSTVILNKLNELGIRISLDDFGTGYSSLSYLKMLPIDKLKIDRSFITDITVNDNDKAIVATIIAMAQHLKMDVIAEGIETKDQLDILTANDCREIQGYYFSRPLSADEVESAFFVPLR
ncbi:EAL domain-containing protein [Paenibacillus sp. H1-7]|uniref:putative bifunctional diguanylate cyclase/phosphodiesterase n=1 Tax=Paenibacillus sp. H1-7 TaxID=2282849 RepID=UPI001EF83452|nr:EAL domain-containing protein [Paenibacillus sp. H1-7]ULL18919.1 EAL domain-containing protein [Paenibacillus sp. H1-7]